MTIKTVLHKTEKSLRDNSPAILTAIGVSGTLSTAYLAGKASYEIGYGFYDDMPTKDYFKKHWKKYIPAAISATITVGCVIASNRIGSKRAAAAYSLLSISEKALHEYREKVVETIGVRKEQGVRDAIAQDKVTNNPPNTKEIILASGGDVLCHELHTGRYFKSDIETLRKAENQLNARIHREMYATLSDFYSIVGLPYTSNSDDVGWDTDKLMELKFTTVLADNGQPCIAFDYNYLKPMR